MRYPFQLAGVVFILCLGMAGEAVAQQGQDAAVVEQVVAAWRKRRTAMKTFAYTVEGVQIHGKGVLTTKERGAAPNLKTTFPTEDLSFDMKVVYKFDLESRKARVETTDHILMQEKGVFRLRKRVAVFDGRDTTVMERREDNTTEVYTPTPSQPDLYVYKGGTGSLFWRESYPILAAHGILGLYSGTMDEAQIFDKAIDASLFRFRQWSSLDGRKCAVLRTTAEAGKLGVFDEFWVDLNRDAAILCWRLFRGGNVTSQNLVKYQLVEGQWLPESWQYDLHRFNQGATPTFMRTDRMKVIDIRINPKLASQDFAAPFRHDMVLSDTHGNFFAVASDDKTLVPYGASTSIRSWPSWVGLSLLFAVLLGGFAYWVRHKQRGGSASTRS